VIQTRDFPASSIVPQPNTLPRVPLGLYLKTIKRQYIYTSIEDSEVVLVFERNNAGFKKLSSFV
jgi:hypothetical protein